MRREIHVRPLLLKSVGLGDNCVGKWSRRTAASPVASSGCRVGAYRECLGGRPGHGVTPRGQGHGRGHVNLPSCHRQVDQWAPDRLRKKTPEMNLDLRKGTKGAEVGMLARRRTPIRYPGHSRREVEHLVQRVLCRQDVTNELDGIQPPVGCVLDGSVVQIEPVHIYPGSQRHPQIKQGPLGGAALEPTARCQRVSMGEFSANSTPDSSVPSAGLGLWFVLTGS